MSIALILDISSFGEMCALFRLCLLICYLLDPQAPRSVSSFCEVIVWQAPSRAYGAITGYDVMFADTVSTSNSSVVQNLVVKNRDQFFHVVRESNLPRPGGAPMIQVVKQVKYTYGWAKNVFLS